MSKVKGTTETHFGDDDATLKELILNTACRVQAIEELLNETHHMCEYTVKHNMSDILIKKSDIEARANSIKGQEPYLSGYKSTKSHGSPSHSAGSYLRAFMRNLFDPK